MEAAAKLMHEQHTVPINNRKRCFGTGRIICTQPRRISCTSVAERVCFERNEKIGARVGYQIRFEQRATDSTELLYCTDGILLRFLVGNPKLEGISCVIVDEAHERGVHTDTILLILKDLVLERKDTAEPLKVVLMSATIDASNFLRYFDPKSTIQFNNMASEQNDNREEKVYAITTGDSNDKDEECPFTVSFIEIPGKTNYPIKEYFIEDLFLLGSQFTPRSPSSHRGRKSSALETRNAWASSSDAVKAKYKELGLDMKNNSRDQWKYLSAILQQPFEVDVDLICNVVEHIEHSESLDNSSTLGSILIFVPGWADITNVIKQLEVTSRKRFQGCKWNLLPLHSMVPPKDQLKVFDDPKKGVRKIVISTNLAETSITIEDVVYVIDSGLMRGTTYNPHTNIAALETMQISRSNAQQRRGRAGRCKPGTLFKLYSELEFIEEMSDHELPEMLRTPVEELCLRVKALQLPGDLPVREVLRKAIDPPNVIAVENAETLLIELGAFECTGLGETMTPLGWKLSMLPIHPCLGKMLLLGSLFARYSEQKSTSGDGNILPSLISICSTLSFKSPFVLPFGKEKEADDARKEFGRGLHSDHLLFAKVLDEYNQRKSRGDIRTWLGKNYMSGKTLEMTDRIKQDLMRYLQDIDVNVEVSPDTNIRARQLFHDELNTPLLSAILAASLNISFLPPGNKKLSSVHGGSLCSTHPSSLLSMLESLGDANALWKRYRHLLRNDNHPIVESFVLDQPDKLFIVGWFERLKTSDVYLRDCSLISDPLPMILLLPGIRQRGDTKRSLAKGDEVSPFANDPTIFEVIGCKAGFGGITHNPRQKNLATSSLLLKVRDDNTARLLSDLRQKLGVFFAAVLARDANSNPSEGTETCLRDVFSGLACLIDHSHSLYISSEYSSAKRNDDHDTKDVIALHNYAACQTLNPNLDESDASSSEDDSHMRYGKGYSVTYSDGGDNVRGNGHSRIKRGRGNSWGRGGAKCGRGRGRSGGRNR